MTLNQETLKNTNVAIIQDAAPIKRICVFCGSSFGNNPKFRVAAKALGQSLADRQIELVYGGGQLGLMGDVASVVASKGVERNGSNSVSVTGVIPRPFLEYEAQVLKEKDPDYVANVPELGAEVISNGTKTIVVADMHTRKKTMSDMADCFVVLPGGFGTFEELLEMVTWTQLKIHNKPIGLLNVDGFFNPFLSLVEHMKNTGFIHNSMQDILLVSEDPCELIDNLQRHVLPADSQFDLHWKDIR